VGIQASTRGLFGLRIAKTAINEHLNKLAHEEALE
jgi:hypothetical protein